MAAYDVFLRSRLNAFIMSRCGAFSVDRESLDTQALKHAHNVLLKGRHALTVFAEGNVFLQNDILAPMRTLRPHRHKGHARLRRAAGRF
jgi:hypothetical protein